MKATITFHTSGFRGQEKRVLTIRNRNRPMQESMDYAHWRYCGEGGPHEPLIFWATHATAGDIGMAALVPRAYCVDGKPEWIFALGDISVDREWRGKGVALDMFAFLNSYAASERLGTLLVLPNQRAAPTLTKAGWTKAGELHRHVLLLDPSEKLARAIRLPKVANTAGELYRSCMNRFVLGRGSRKVHASESHSLPDSFSALWEKLPKRGRIIRDRSDSTMRWRYEQQPGRQYRFLTFTCGGKVTGASVTFESQAERAVHVLDLLIAEEQLTDACLAALIAHTLSNRSVHTMRILLNATSRLRPRLRRFGFLDRDATTPLQIRQATDSLMNRPEAWLIRDGDKDA